MKSKIEQIGKTIPKGDKIQANLYDAVATYDQRRIKAKEYINKIYTE